MNRLLISIALLAGIMLAGSCNLLRPNRGESQVVERVSDEPVVQPIDDLSVIKPARGGDMGEEYAPRTLIITYDTIVGTAPLDSAIIDYGATVIYRYHMISGLAIRIPDDKDIHDAIKYFSSVEGVIAVNRDRIMHLH